MFVCPECGGALAGPGRCPADGAEVVPIGEDVLLGTTIGAYRVARLLGIGGMGRVYKGVHPTIGSRVAIKVLSRECSDRRDLVDRFFAEAKAVNLIRHESIVNVLDLAVLPDGRPYIIMEYLDGAPLAAIVEHAVATATPLPLGGLARLVAEVLDALGAAHAKGIIHRDLKPDNIFVTPSGRPKVLDFGIAKLNDAGGGGSATRTGSLLGTPHYMSPEQAAGRPVDLRADVYAIGVILFECATGRKPFVADSLFDLLRQHVEVPPPSPRALRPDLPAALEQVILTALAKAPEQRFASAHAMSVALQHATAQLEPAAWAPITGAGPHRAQPSNAWQPTPPVSWGSAPSHGGPAPGSGARHGGTVPDSAPPAPGPRPPSIGHHSTVSASAGQLQRVAPARGRGVWLGLGVALLVGGGVAAGVLATRGGDAPPAPAPAATAAGEQASPPAAPGAPVAPPSATAGEVAAGDEAADEAPPRAPAPAIDTQIEQALEGLDGLDQLDQLDLSALPPEARKQLDELRKLQKLPPAQRAKKLRALQQDLTRDLGRAAELLSADGTPPAEAPEPAPAPAPSARAPGRPIDGPWVADHQLASFPLNPRRVDVSAFIRYAIAEAKKADPEAVLFRISIDGVTADGFANLELPSHASDTGSIELRFFSPARAKPDPRTPIGVRAKAKVACEFRIEAEPDGVELREIGPAFGGCDKDIPVPVPRCSIVDLWKRAIAKGAPATNAVANLSYYATGIGGRSAYWWFDIGSGADKVFSARFPSC